jgi:chemotaxis signal transduction protein
VVRSGEIRCALPADRVRRVARDLICHPLPGGRPHLLGLAQFGGEPMAVLDLYALVTGGEPRLNPRATVILDPNRLRERSVLGLGVDEAIHVISLPKAAGEFYGEGLVRGTVMSDGHQVTVLSPDVLFDTDWTPGEEAIDA